MLIKAGDKVIYLGVHNLWVHPAGNPVDGPYHGDVLTVRDSGVKFVNGEPIPILWFEEYPGNTTDDSFDATGFEPFS